jgi:hypothetical protein
MKQPRSRPVSLPTLLITLGAAVTAQGQVIRYQAPTGPGGTWNLYEFVLGALNMKDAHLASNGTLNPIAGQTAPGYLVEIGSAFENTLVNNITYRGDAWIGFTDRAGVVAGASEGVFAWTNGAPAVYTNWNGGEPNDVGGEDGVHISGGGGWNDNRSGFLVDDPIAAAGNTDESGGPAFRFLREYATASPTPLPGVRSAAALGFVGSLTASLPAPTNGNFSVREIRGLVQGNIYEATNNALSGGGVAIDAQIPRLDVTDPETNPAGGPVVGGTPLPFLSNTAGDDNDILTIAKAKVVVPESGDWTIQVRSDDGFALRIPGQNFTSVNGGGQIDPLDSSTMYFYGGTGDANTRGVINLPAGTYDMEFVNWEGGGGAYYEVTTAKGAITAPGGAQFLAMGDTSTLPAVPNVLRLTAPATVQTAAEGTAGGGTANNIGETRALITTAIGAGATNNGAASSVAIGDGQAIPFPAGTPADEFGMKVTGSFTLDDGDAAVGEMITLTFGMFSDDGSQLRIIGQDFSAVSDFTGDGVAGLVDVGGDMSLTADYFTGNTNAFGAISLTEGTFNFEAFMFEGGGGANLSILYSLGDKTGVGNDGTFIPLSTSLGLPSNTGWALVPEPGVSLLALLGCGILGRRRRL